MFKNLTELQKQYFYVAGIAATLTALGFITAPVGWLSWFAFCSAGFAGIAFIAVVAMEGVNSLMPVKEKQEI